MADSAPQVLQLLGAYMESLRSAAILPEWWQQVPLESPNQVQERMVELMGIVSLTSRQLDHRRCRAAKQAMHVFAVALWKLKPRKGSKRPA